jgi:hypothetical protein
MCVIGSTRDRLILEELVLREYCTYVLTSLRAAYLKAPRFFLHTNRDSNQDQKIQRMRSR